MSNSKTSRRDFLKGAGVITASLLAGQTIVSGLMIPRAQAMTGLPIQDLKNALGNDGSLVLVPSDHQFAAYQIAFNKRKMIMPQLRVLPNGAEAVAKTIQWARVNGVPFAIRSGGHSYEGYSQSDGLVIDVRLMHQLEFDAASSTVTVGSGNSLGDVYKYLAKFKMAIPAGSCPPVGVAGHTLGGGFGLIARKYGLACDNVESLEMVDAQGNILQVSETENPDLFWAMRGGGNGNFGIVTKFVFRTHEIGKVSTFGISWILKPEQAQEVLKLWQRWAPNTTEDITSIFKVSRGLTPGHVNMRCAGLTVGSFKEVQSEVHKLMKTYPGLGLGIKSMPFIESVMHFAGSFNYTSINMKAKSDYLVQPMSDDGIQMLMKGLNDHPTGLSVIHDSYGGAVSRFKNDQTAFAHRENAVCVMQYYSEWNKDSETPQKLKNMREIYDGMRPFVSGGSYVNYCDLDLTDYAKAYWGDNLTRLQSIKLAVDPDNFFRHAQSIPLPKP